MKTILKSVLVFAALISATGVQGQNFLVSPADSAGGTFASDGFASVNVELQNQTTESLLFKWRLVDISFSPQWDYSLCDLGSCYPVVPDSAEMDITSPGGDAFFTCHMSFNNTNGYGALRIFVYEDGDEANGDTITFGFTAVTPTAIAETPLSNPLDIYPNPTTGQVTISLNNQEMNGEFSILDLSGKTIHSQRLNGAVNHIVSLKDQKAGTYIVTYQLNGQVWTKRLVISKQ